MKKQKQSQKKLNQANFRKFLLKSALDLKLWILLLIVFGSGIDIVLNLHKTSADQAPVQSIAQQFSVKQSSNVRSITISGVDLHDGMLAKFGNTYYLYGTEYGCGFNWAVHNTTFCGFGVSTSSDLISWSKPKLLFSPSSIDPYSGLTWNDECAATGAGCFNPRMIQRSGWGVNDGVFVLWFNSPADYFKNKTNAYNAMGCNGPAGPCGPTAGAPSGSYNKPRLSICTDDGDFAINTNTGGNPVIVCSMGRLSEEQLDHNGTNGTGVGSHNLAGLSGVEGPGIYKDIKSGTWIMTYSDPGCGYCTGTGTGYATASSALGPWQAVNNVAAGGSAPPTGRRDISANSDGGQPRTISVVDGQAYQGIDIWTGSRNETVAGTIFEPLTYTPSGIRAVPGTAWHPPFAQWGQ